MGNEEALKKVGNKCRNGQKRVFKENEKKSAETPTSKGRKPNETQKRRREENIVIVIITTTTILGSRGTPVVAVVAEIWLEDAERSSLFLRAILTCARKGCKPSPHSPSARLPGAFIPGLVNFIPGATIRKVLAGLFKNK